MLQNEPQSEPSPPPGQRRITPEELSQAVAAIEQRKQQEAQRLAGTIPIEEAVSSLHLDTTPEEIWAQVHAQREAEAARQAQAEAAQRAQQARQAQAVPPQAQVQAAPQFRGRRRGWWRWLPLGALFWVLYGTGVLRHIGSHTPPAPPALSATEAQIPDGRQFYCDSSGLVQISEGKAPPQVHVSATEQFENSWTLVKMNGHVYLRAFTLPLDSVQAAKGKPLVLYNDDNSGGLEGNTTAQTTVRVDGTPLQISGGDAGYTQITMPDFQPDTFTTTSPWR